MKAGEPIYSFLKVSLALAFLLASSCSYKIDKEGNNQFGDADRPSPSMIAHASFAQANAVLQANCVSCHGRSGGVNLETYESARSFLAQIRQ